MKNTYYILSGKTIRGEWKKLPNATKDDVLEFTNARRKEGKWVQVWLHQPTDDFLGARIFELNNDSLLRTGVTQPVPKED